MEIVYKFTLGDGTAHNFSVDLDRSAATANAQLPQWTQLTYQQCSNCPLKPIDGPYCPPAVDLAPVIGAFAKIISHHETKVEVETTERTISKNCQVQVALSSLVALIMATSACPILGRMRGLARIHLPFATMEETLFRSVGAYLLKQLLVQKNGGEPDWELTGLRDFYSNLEILNKHFTKRVRAAAEQDAALNAVSALGVLSMGVGFSIDDLDELAQFAAPAD